MRRLSLPLTTVIALALVLAAPGVAQTPDEVVEAVSDLGYFIEEGFPADSAAISDDITRARNGGLRLGVVLLVDGPSGGATVFADAVLDRLGEGTVLVVSATDAGMVSTETDQSAIEAALDRGLTASQDAPPGEENEAFVDAAVGSLLQSSGRGDDQPATDGGGAGLIVLAAVIFAVVGLVLVVWWGIRRSRQEQEQATDQVSASETPEDDDRFQGMGK